MSFALRSRNGASALRAAAGFLAAPTTASPAFPAIAASHRPIAIVASPAAWAAPCQSFSASPPSRAADALKADDHHHEHEVEHTIDNPPPRHAQGHPPKSRYNPARVLPTEEEILAHLSPAEKKQWAQAIANLMALPPRQGGGRRELVNQEFLQRAREAKVSNPALLKKTEAIYVKLLAAKNPDIDHHDHHHHHEEFNPNTGYLFGVKPGEKAEREGWEIPIAVATAAFAVFVVLLMFKPNTRLDSWALEEARRRLEKEGILEDTYPTKTR